MGMQVSDRIILMGKLWRNLNHTVILLYCNESIVFTDLKSESFDVIIKAQNADELLTIAMKINNSIYHYFNYGPDQLGYYLYSNKFTYIYDYKDLFSNIVHQTIDDNSLAIEKEIVKNSVAITRRDEQIFYYLKMNSINYNLEKIIYSPGYFNKEIEYENKVVSNLSNYNIDKPIKIIMSGGYLSESNPESILYEGISHLVKQFAGNGLEIDLIGNFSSSLSHEAGNFPLLTELVNRKWVNILPMTNSEDFDNILLNYDFAMHMFNFDVIESDYTIQFKNSNLLDYGGSARIYSFIKANLPIILGKSLPHIKNVLKNSGFTIEYRDEYKDSMENILNNYRVANYKKEIYPYRDRFNDRVATINFKENIKQIGKEIYA